MTIPGFFAQQLTPNFRIWFCDENVNYVRNEVSRRLSQYYTDKIELEYDYVYMMLVRTHGTWKGPLTLDELLEMVICNFVNDLMTDIQFRNRFNDYEPRRIMMPDTDLTAQEKIKLKPGYKLTFQMNY